MTSKKDFTHAGTGSKREDFKKYLEKTGALQALSEALVSLFEEPEKPQDAVKYLQNKLQKVPDCHTVEVNEKTQQELKCLQKENEELKAKIQLLEAQISSKEAISMS